MGVDMVAGLTVVLSCLAWSGDIMFEEVVLMTVRMFGGIYGFSLTCACRVRRVPSRIGLCLM